MAIQSANNLGFQQFRGTSRVSFLCMLSLLVLLTAPYVQSQTTRVDYRISNLQNRACSLGRLQSPIHLTGVNSTYTDTIFLATDSYLTVNDAVLNYDGRLLEVTSLSAVNGMNTDFGYVTLRKDGVSSKYGLTKMVIKTPAEHVIEGVRHDLEVQFIHEKDLDFQASVNDFKGPSEINMYLVVSVLFSTTGSYNDNNFIESLFDYYNTNANNQASFNLEVEETFLLRNKRFYFYEGSLTVDPCDETHLYYVVADVFRIQADTLQRFRDTYSNFYTNSTFNKPLAKYKGRQVVRNFATAEDSAFKFSVSFVMLVWIFALFI